MKGGGVYIPSRNKYRNKKISLTSSRREFIPGNFRVSRGLTASSGRRLGPHNEDAFNKRNFGPPRLYYLNEF